jgi:hypothetical protein
MRLDQALTKIGVHVVQVDSDSERMTLFLRVAKEPLAARRWNLAASQFVQAAANSGQKSGTWNAEVSKVLYSKGSIVKFSWRVILSGNLKTAQRVFGEAALAALKAGVEVTSAPLVGNRPPVHDPAKGKIKGGYMVGSAGDSVAASVIARHFMPGVS